MMDDDDRTEWIDKFIHWLTKNTDAQGNEAAYEAELEAGTQADIHGADAREWDHPDVAAARIRDEWGHAANEDADDD